MSGLQIKLDVAVTDTSIPKLWPDSIMSEGSILLIDFNRESLVSVPSLNATIRNIARDTLATVSGVSAGLDASFSRSEPVLPAEMVLGLTPKGALQGLYTKTADVAPNAFANINVPLAVKNYLIANQSHKFFISDWVKKIYNWASGNTADILIGSSAAYSNNSLAHAGTGGYIVLGSAGRNLGVRTQTLDGVLGRCVAVDGALGNINNATLFSAYWKMCGALGAYGSFEVNKGVSNALYRLYIEDLTVSGRTFAEVEALDTELFNEAFGVGGRLHGDNYLDPATLP